MRIERRSHMDNISPSADSQAPAATSPSRATLEQQGLTADYERVLALESESTAPLQSSIGLKQPIWLELVGGRKMGAYIISVLATTVLAITGQATSEVLLAIQTALGVFTGGNAAEHKFKGQK